VATVLQSHARTLNKSDLLHIGLLSVPADTFDPHPCFLSQFSVSFDSKVGDCRFSAKHLPSTLHRDKKSENTELPRMGACMI
jgi:hypothetical protein